MRFLFPLVVLIASVLIGLLCAHEGFVGISADDKAAQEAAFQALQSTYDQGSYGDGTHVSGSMLLPPSTTPLPPSTTSLPPSTTSLPPPLPLSLPLSLPPSTTSLSQGVMYKDKRLNLQNDAPVPTEVPIVYGSSSCSRPSIPVNYSDPIAVQVNPPPSYPFPTADQDTCESRCD